MIEIILIVLMGLQLKKMAEAKGRPAKWGLLALLIPAVGWPVAFVAGIVSAATTGQAAGVDTPGFWIAAAITYTSELLVALGICQYVKRLAPVAGAPVPALAAPAGAVPVPPAAPTRAVGQALAGTCAECGQNVWLEPDGSCPNGHPASSISGTYMALKG
jgi:hypothetical protein